jgi:hypothetical protein
VVWSLIALIAAGTVVGLRFRIPIMIGLTAGLVVFLAARSAVLHSGLLESLAQILLAIFLFQAGYLAGRGLAFVWEQNRRQR